MTSKGLSTLSRSGLCGPGPRTQRLALPLLLFVLPPRLLFCAISQIVALDTPTTCTPELHATMPLVTRLPRRSIPGQLRHLWIRAPAVHECRHFSMSFKKSQDFHASIICLQTVRRDIAAALLPYAVALMEASRLPRPLVGSSVIALLDELYSQPNRLAARVPQLPPGLAHQINSTYDAMGSIATDFAACALKRLSSRGTSALLSPAEDFRFRRAVYRVELFHTLFRGDAFADKMNSWFFSRHPPGRTSSLLASLSTWRQGLIEVRYPMPQRLSINLLQQSDPALQCWLNVRMPRTTNSAGLKIGN